jgi:hypothetical protein
MYAESINKRKLPWVQYRQIDEKLERADKPLSFPCHFEQIHPAADLPFTAWSRIVGVLSRRIREFMSQMKGYFYGEYSQYHPNPSQ